MKSVRAENESTEATSLAGHAQMQPVGQSNIMQPPAVSSLGDRMANHMDPEPVQSVPLNVDDMVIPAITGGTGNQMTEYPDG